ncbi:MAG: metallophosphoesterase [Chitinophagaceae bacterium]|nr:MAG: metallophosphoesterase [Chitinophagaceae bacterium]
MRFYLLITVLLTCPKLFAQKDTVQSRIILVGDAGALVKGKSAVIDAIKRQMPLDKKTTVIFLGDNLYDIGLPDVYHKGYNEAKAALDSQVTIAHGKDAKVLIIPGNHDWNNAGPGGEAAIQRQQLYVDYSGEKNVKFYPEGGCPGPVEVKISEDVVMIIIDSQWWLHPFEKPGVESDCDQKTQEQVLGELEDLLSKNMNKLVIFASHHPFKSNGVHGGYFTWKQHLFPFTEMRQNLYIPLPVIGSIYPIARSVFGTPQDIPHPAYQNMITKLNSVLDAHPHLVRVHGHEHNLQWIQNDSLAQLITGSGCKTQRVSDGRDTKYTARNLGFAVLEVSDHKTAKATFYEMDADLDSVQPSYSARLMEFSKLPVLEKKDTTEAVFVYKDRATAPASLQYPPTHGFKRLMNGSNYRAEWSVPVDFKVFNIKKEKGGFKIMGVGGGKQTKSLQLEDKDGVEWVLRTIDKDPELTLPEGLRGSFAQSIVQDIISASHPYAPLAVPDLADAAGVMAPRPEFFYVPDDPALGYYRPYFASKICMLEKKELSKSLDSKSSEKLFNKMREDNDQTVDQAQVLNARLLDMLVGDWDRHFGQWRWIPTDTGKGKYFIPVPRDRDQAFSWSNGMLVKAASRRFDVLKGFRREFDDINEWNSTAKDFDRYFMNQLDWHTWDSVTNAFYRNVDSADIVKAVKKFPAEVYAIDGEVITDKLMNRRATIRKESEKYYKFISETVTVLGSNKNEFFHLSADDMGNPKLEVYAYKDNSDTSFLMYQRLFDPAITKELRLFGFGGDDMFRVEDQVKGKLKVRIIGGRGEDSFVVNGSVRTYLYDNTNEKTGVVTGPRTRKKFSADADVNNYELDNYKYSNFSYPTLALGYNGVDGVFVGTGFSIRTHGFRKEPFSTEHKFAGLFALGQRAHTVKYSGEFIRVFGKNDVLVNARYAHPGLNFFFGFGNKTKIADGLDGDDYRVRYNYLDADVLIRHRVARIFSISVGPTVFHYWNRFKDNTKYVLSTPEALGLDSASVFSPKTYIGGKILFDLNNINNPLFPTRGISWRTQFSSLHSIHGNDTRAVNKLESDLVVYASLRDPARVVTVLRLGAGHIFENTYEFFQAMSFGSNRDLRGFRRNRYSGSTMAYGSLEFRVKMFDIKNSVLPGQVGLLTFGDLGRVWYRPESSKAWHPAFGGGVYFIPFNMVFLSAGLAKSDELLFNISIGTKLNVTF